ncbi:MAG: hypothetical protein EXQ52_15480 [Bryobacterales bacterium]|nr:hypothetical protein [Bryobacterales bacterium]
MPKPSAFLLLLAAALLEAGGDSCFQTAIHRSSGIARVLWALGGAAALAFYGVLLNTPRWNFGELLGVYVVVFFVVAQAIAWLRFGDVPALPILVGGALIVLGGTVITLWKI